MPRGKQSPKQAFDIVSGLVNGESLTKNHLVRIVSRVGGIDLKYSRSIVNNVLFGLIEMFSEMREGDRLEIRGFGVFEMHKTKATLNKHNPATLQKIPVGAKRKLIFRPGKDIKRKLLKLI